MKKIFIVAVVVFSLMATQKTNAQFRMGVNINIGSQPRWAPSGYDYAEYYYLPDIESYYYVPRHQFIYLSNGAWVFSSSLPGRYRDYDLYSGYKVVINRPGAYLYFNQDRERYGRYRNYYNRQDLRYRRDDDDRDYRRDDREHHDNGRHRGWYKHDRD